MLVVVFAGTIGGLVGIATDLGAVGVGAIAATLAVAGDIDGHLLGRDAQFRAAVRAVTGDR